MNVSSDELKVLIEQAAKKAAQEAVTETLEKLGVDLQNHLEMQEDFALLRRWRQMSEKVGSRILVTLFTIATVGVAGLVWSQVGGESR